MGESSFCTAPTVLIASQFSCLYLHFHLPMHSPSFHIIYLSIMFLLSFFFQHFSMDISPCPPLHSLQIAFVCWGPPQVKASISGEDERMGSEGRDNKILTKWEKLDLVSHKMCRVWTRKCTVSLVLSPLPYFGNFHSMSRLLGPCLSNCG